MQLMNAVQIHEYGDESVLSYEKIAVPEPKDGQLLVRVVAAGVNYADLRRRQGDYLLPTPLPFVLGFEVAGIVERVGRGVSNTWMGKAVVARLSRRTGGGYAEFAVVDESRTVEIPDGIPFEEALAVPMQGLTAYFMLKGMGRLEKGETVLVHAGAGGVGLFAIQLAKTWGAKVVATASSEEKLALMKDFGADAVVNYTAPEWQKSVVDQIGYIDIALESVGGEIFQKTLEVMNEKGRLIVYGRSSKQDVLFDPRSLMRRNLYVSGFFLGGFSSLERDKAAMQECFGYMKSGDVRIKIGGVYSLKNAAQAHADMKSRKTIGKLVLKP